MYAVVVLGRQVNSGELAAHKGRGAFVVAAQQLQHAEAVAFGLEDTTVLDRAKLADGAVGGAEDGIRRCVERSCTLFQGAGEEGIEVLVGVQLLDFGFAHVDLVLLGKPVDQAALEPACLALGGAADQAREQVVGQQVLAEDEQALLHGDSFNSDKCRRAGHRPARGNRGASARPGCRGGCPIRPTSRHRL